MVFVRTRSNRDVLTYDGIDLLYDPRRHVDKICYMEYAFLRYPKTAIRRMFAICVVKPFVQETHLIEV